MCLATEGVEPVAATSRAQDLIEACSSEAFFSGVCTASAGAGRGLWHGAVPGGAAVTEGPEARGAHMHKELSNLGLHDEAVKSGSSGS